MSYVEDEYYDDEEYSSAYEDAQWAPVSGELGGQPHTTAATENICTTLTVSEVMEELRRDVEKANEILGLTPEAALLVLRRYGWKMDDATLENYLNDMENINKDLRIIEVAGSGTDGVALVQSDTVLECPICCDDVPVGKAVALARCGHFFCVDCFTTNLLCAIKHYHDLFNKRCPMKGCSCIVGLNVFKELLQPKEYGQVQRRFLGEYLSNNTHMRCCPNEVSCEGVIRVNALRESGPDVRCCMCGLEFCFKCLQSPHAPATCQMLRRWMDMVRENEPSLALIQQTTKGCPKCSVRVEKNKGCNHMTCVRCQYEYCWICLGPWSEHNTQYYKCDKQVSNDEVKSGKQLFLDCYERWDNHKRSIMLEARSLEEGSKDLRRLAQRRTESLTLDKRLNVLLETQQVLRDCRVVLMNGYIALFFGELADTSFHYRLHQLELRTEETSRLIDVSPELLDADEIQCRVAQAAHWCNVLRKEGFD
ncbi:RING finger protein [Trypanosoma grayi]|uniref:RING finger protein n=1 Tax=Trypanosoma grayi TaxID=71804 RepID=UPI0004F3FD8D|nr:RING finger protein [Trypanosoma grayi]KEG07551.1 RING finger protein [Trypanosoma grayi]